MIMQRWEDYTLKAVKVILPLVFVLPFFVGSDFYFPFITPRNFIFRILIGVVFSLFIMLLIARPRFYIPKKHIVLTSFFAFIGIMTVSSILNGDFLYSLWSGYERMEGLINYYFLAIFLILLISIYKKEHEWELVLRFTLFVSFIIAFIGWAQHLGLDLLLASAGGERVSSTLGNATYLAAYSLFHIFFALYLFLKRLNKTLNYELVLFIILDVVLLIFEKKTGFFSIIFSHSSLAVLFWLPQALLVLDFFLKRKYLFIERWKLYFLVISLANFLAMFHTQTRGALVGFVLALALMLFIYLVFVKGRKKARLSALVGFVVLIMAVSSIFYFKDENFIKDNKPLQRISSISLDDNTAMTRLRAWEAGFKGWKEKPVLGWGEEKFYVVFNKYFPAEIYRHAGSRIWFDRAHNVFVQYLVQGGIVGLFFYIAIFLSVIWSLFKLWRKSDDSIPFLLLGGLIVAYLIQNSFVFDSINTYLLLILSIGFIVFLTRKKSEEGLIMEETQPIVKNPPILALILILGITYSLTIPQAKANLGFIREFNDLEESVHLKAFQENDAQELVDEINRSYLGKFELRHTYADTVRNYMTNKNLSNDDRLFLVKSVEEELLKSIAEQPDNVRHYSFLSSLYVEATPLDLSYADKNINLVNDALELSPTRAHLYYSIGRSYLVRKEPEKALESFRKAVEISPKVIDAHANLIAALITIGDVEAADSHISIIENVLERDLHKNDYKRLAEIYAAGNFFDGAIKLLETALITSPDSVEILSQLASYAVKIGDKEKALSAASRAAELEPSLAEDFEALKIFLEEN